MLICLDAASGEKQYEHRTHPDRHRASPLFADGNSISRPATGR